ncbi:MAG: hypothetical protein K2X62_12835 [Beijerinckiaceae bacterium]|nr:hypothetical protein [Beijerinckiaceae bacterium]
MARIRFLKGDKVRCLQTIQRLDVDLPYFLSELSLPVEGRVYTVREVVETPAHGEGLRFLELQNQTYQHDHVGEEEPCFSPDMFELVIDRTPEPPPAASSARRPGQRAAQRPAQRPARRR